MARINDLFRMGGKVFQLNRFAKTKRTAQEAAKKLRARGRTVRVVKGSGKGIDKWRVLTRG